MIRLRQAARNRSLQQGMALIAGTTLAYALDYAFNLAAGRLLDRADFAMLVALAGAGQVLVVASRVVQTVVTRYVSAFQAGEASASRTASFFRRVFRSALLWGGAGTLLLLALSFPFAAFLKTKEVAPVLALAASTLLMATRPVAGGVLQGSQRFAALGLVQLVQAGLRLALGVALILAGLRVFGAMAALPLASSLTLLFALWLLGRSVWQVEEGPERQALTFPGLFRYSTFAAAGLIGYALLANMDAILAKRFFDPASAGNYAAAVTLGKVVQFFPLAIIMILFPKAARRQAERRDPAGVLLPAFLLVGLLSGALALLYFLFPGPLVRLTLGPGYQVGGRLLGLLGTAMALLSLSNVWLNYFLSLEQTGYVYLVWLAIGLQGVLMAFFHGQQWYLPAIAAGNGLWLTAAGTAIFLRSRRRS